MSDAIMGTFVKVGGTLADGTLRLIIDIEPRHAQDAFALFHVPGTPMALARLTNEAATTQPETRKEEPKEKAGPLCILACNFCQDRKFWQWLDYELSHACVNELDAKRILCEICAIESRKDLDKNSAAAATFHDVIRKPFIEWRDGKAGRAA